MEALRAKHQAESDAAYFVEKQRLLEQTINENDDDDESHSTISTNSQVLL